VENLHHVRDRLEELEEIVNYYQHQLMQQQQHEEETTVYEEKAIEGDDVQRLKILLQQYKAQVPNVSESSTKENNPQHLHHLSNELAAKRL
jgi:hypothetical protein